MMQDSTIPKDNKGFPSQFIDPREKEKPGYGLAYAKAIWGSYMSNLPYWTNWYSRAMLCRKYAEGLESSDKYKPWFLQRPLNQNGGLGDTSFVNIDWSPVNLMATRIDNMVSRIIGIDYRTQISAIDPASRIELDEARDEMRAKMFLRKYNDDVEAITGVPLVPPGEELPETDEDLERHFETNFKQAHAIALEKAIEFVYNDNDFDEETLEMLVRDLLVIKRAAAYYYYDRDKRICVERVDPVKLLTPYTDKPDFSNIPWFGIRKQFRIQDIAAMNPEYTEEQLADIAEKYAGVNQNPTWQLGWKSPSTTYDGYYQNTFGRRPYDSFLIDVMEFRFTSVDIRNYEYYQRDGIDGMARVPHNYKQKKNDTGKRVEAQKWQVVYGGQWIVGSDYVMNYARQKNVVRKREGGQTYTSCELPIVVFAPNIYDMENKSHAERMIPHEDQINLIVYKMRQYLAKARPAGAALNLDALAAVTAGAGNAKNAGLDPYNLAKLYDQTGNIIYRSYDETGRPLEKPIVELANSILSGYRELIVARDQEIQMMNNVSGYNSAVDASSPSTETLVGVMKEAAQNTDNSLGQIARALVLIMKRLDAKIGGMVQDSIQFNNETFMRAIGSYDTKVIEMGKDIPLHEYGYEIEYGPDDRMIAIIQQQTLVAVDRDLIPVGIGINILFVLKKNPQEAARMLSYEQKKYAKQKADQQQQAIITTGQTQQQSAVTTAEQERQTQAQKIEGEKDLYKFQTEQDIEKAKALQPLELERLGLKSLGNENVQHLKNEGAHTTEIIKQAAPEKAESAA